MNPATHSESAAPSPHRFNGTKRYLNPHEAAAYLGMGHSTLSIHRMKGTGPAFIKWASNVRYDIVELDRWMAERVVPRAPIAAPAKRRVGRPRKQHPNHLDQSRAKTIKEDRVRAER